MSFHKRCSEQKGGLEGSDGDRPQFSGVHQQGPQPHLGVPVRLPQVGKLSLYREGVAGIQGPRMSRAAGAVSFCIIATCSP